jgi:zinc protease
MKALIFLFIPLVLAVSAADLEMRLLENGLTVIVSHDDTSPVVTICIAVKTGATCETPETNGLAHFYEHMFFKGNEALPDQTAYNRRMSELGIIQNGATSTERVWYHITLGSDNFEEGLQFMFDAITSPLFDHVEMERERDVIMNEYDRGLTHPFHNLTLAMEEVIFADAPWRQSPIGVPEVIQAAAPPAMHAFQEHYYTPDNSALIIAGMSNMKKLSDWPKSSSGTGNMGAGAITIVFKGLSVLSGIQLFLLTVPRVPDTFR